MNRLSINEINSDQLDELYERLARVRALHQPVGVVAATEFGQAPDCPVCGPNWWPCPTYEAVADLPSPAPAATDSHAYDGPTVAECTANDHAHWNDKYAGEGP